MVGPTGFKASGLLSLPGVLGTAGNLSAHTSFFVHLSNPLYVLIHLPTSFHHPCILCPLSHLHNLTCHAFVPLCLSLFLPILPFFSLSVVHFQAWWSGRKKDDALSLHYFLIRASRKEGRERDKVKSGKTEGWEEYRSSAEWLQNGDWDRSYCSCGDATLHRERGSVCEREGGLNSLNQCKKKHRRHTFPHPLHPRCLRFLLLSPAISTNQSLSIVLWLYLLVQSITIFKNIVTLQVSSFSYE